MLDIMYTNSSSNLFAYKKKYPAAELFSGSVNNTRMYVVYYNSLNKAFTVLSFVEYYMTRLNAQRRRLD